jgi:hypothetical protein
MSPITSSILTLVPRFSALEAPNGRGIALGSGRRPPSGGGTTWRSTWSRSLGEYLVGQIGAELVERYVSEKIAERRAGEALIERLEGSEATRGELRDARKARGLSHVSINKTLTLFRQVLNAAVSYGYIDRNPVDDVKRLATVKKAQPFLQPDQVDVRSTRPLRATARCS